jgi:hypothetical protein
MSVVENDGKEPVEIPDVPDSQPATADTTANTKGDDEHMILELQKFVRDEYNKLKKLRKSRRSDEVKVRNHV